MNQHGAARVAPGEEEESGAVASPPPPAWRRMQEERNSPGAINRGSRYENESEATLAEFTTNGLPLGSSDAELATASTFWSGGSAGDQHEPPWRSQHEGCGQHSGGRANMSDESEGSLVTPQEVEYVLNQL